MKNICIHQENKSHSPIVHTERKIYVYIKKIRATALLHILKEKYMYVYIKEIRATALLHILKEKYMYTSRK